MQNLSGSHFSGLDIELASINNAMRSMNLVGSYTAGKWQRHTVSGKIQG